MQPVPIRPVQCPVSGPLGAAQFLLASPPLSDVHAGRGVYEAANDTGRYLETLRDYLQNVGELIEKAERKLAP
jgi:hypothetical protein